MTRSGGPVAKRGDWPPSPLRTPHRRLLPQRARAGSSQGGLRAATLHDWPHPRLRDCGLAEGGAGGVLEPKARHPRLHPREGLALRCAHRAGGDARDTQNASRRPRREALQALWSKFAAERGIAKEKRRSVGVRNPAPATALEIAWRVVAQMEERASVFPRREALALALAHSPGLYDLKTIEGAFDELERDKHLLPTIRRGVGEAWTTARAVNAEREVIERMRGRHRRGGATHRRTHHRQRARRSDRRPARGGAAHPRRARPHGRGAGLRRDGQDGDAAPGGGVGWKPPCHRTRPVGVGREDARPGDGPRVPDAPMVPRPLPRGGRTAWPMRRHSMR